MGRPDGPAEKANPLSYRRDKQTHKQYGINPGAAPDPITSPSLQRCQVSPPRG